MYYYMDSGQLVTRINSTPSEVNLNDVIIEASRTITIDMRSNFILAKMDLLKFTRNINQYY